MTTQAPKVTVIIAIYNAAEYLHQCLDSVVAQELCDIEIICVNDGSTDNSLEILQDYAAKDNRIKVITQENQGPGAARNAGLKYARGKYISLLDSDDFFAQSMLREMYETAEEQDCDIVVCNTERLNCETNTFFSPNNTLPSDKLNNNELLDPFSAGDIPEHFLQGFVYWAWDKLFRIDLIKNNDIVFPDLYGPEDSVFTIKALFLAQKIGTVNKPLVVHREFRQGSVESTRYKAPFDNFIALRMIKTFLLEKEMFFRFEKTFVNYTLAICYWSIFRCSWRASVAKVEAEAFLKEYNYFKGIFIREMELMKYPEDYFYNKWEYAALVFINSRDAIHYFISAHELEIFYQSFEKESELPKELESLQPPEGEIESLNEIESIQLSETEIVPLEEIIPVEDIEPLKDIVPHKEQTKITFKKLVKYLLPYGLVRFCQLFINNRRKNETGKD